MSKTRTARTEAYARLYRLMLADERGEELDLDELKDALVAYLDSMTLADQRRFLNDISTAEFRRYVIEHRGQIVSKDFPQEPSAP